MIDGGDGTDTLYGGEGADNIHGDGGNDDTAVITVGFSATAATGGLYGGAAMIFSMAAMATIILQAATIMTR